MALTCSLGWGPCSGVSWDFGQGSYRCGVWDLAGRQPARLCSCYLLGPLWELEGSQLEASSRPLGTVLSPRKGHWLCVHVLTPV